MSSFVLQVISYNIHKGFNAASTKFVLPRIRSVIKQLDMDLVFLQEVQGKHKPRRLRRLPVPEEPQTEYLAEDNWPYYIYGKNATYGHAHHGNALLSKFPFVLWENINVALSPRASRSLLHGVIKLPEIALELHVICIHLGLLRTERTKQLVTLSEQIRQKVPQNAPLIIAGDFNDWRRKAVGSLEGELGLQEVFKTLYGDHARTFPAWRPAFKVDRIYFRGLELNAGIVLKRLPWSRLSDHLPLIAEFRL